MVQKRAQNEMQAGKRVAKEGIDFNNKAKGSVLELHQRGICLQRLCNVRCSLSFQIIVAEAASENRNYTSRAADGRER